MSDTAVMKTRELIKKLRKYAKDRGLEFSVNTRRGKGSHCVVKLADKKATVPQSDDLPAGTIAAICQQLGIDKKDL